MAKRKIPTAEEMEIGLRRRSGFKSDQLISLARNGDAESLAKCAAVAVNYVDGLEVQPEHADLKDWLQWALLDLKDGKSPNEAFGWRSGPANRPPDFMIQNRQHQVVISVEARIAESPERDRGEIFEEVGTVYGLKEDTVATYFNNRRT